MENRGYEEDIETENEEETTEEEEELIECNYLDDEAVSDEEEFDDEPPEQTFTETEITEDNTAQAQVHGIAQKYKEAFQQFKEQYMEPDKLDKDSPEYRVLKGTNDDLERYFSGKETDVIVSIMKSNQYLLHVACFKGDVEKTKYLCSLVDQKLLNDLLQEKLGGYTPLHVASLLDHAEVVRCFLEIGLSQTVLSDTDLYKCTFFQTACIMKCWKTIDLILELYANDDKMYKHLAWDVRCEDGIILHIVEQLHGEKLFGILNDSQNLLFMYIFIFSRKILQKLFDKFSPEEIIELVKLNQGASVHLACEYLEIAPMELLLEHFKIKHSKEHLKTVLEIKDENLMNETVLHIACRQRSPDLAKLLLDCNLSEVDYFTLLKLTNHESKTVLHVACQNNTEYVVEWVAEKLSKSQAEEPEGNKEILHLAADMLSLQDINGNTALHIACSLEHFNTAHRIASLMLQFQLDDYTYITKRNLKKMTALHLACQHGLTDVVRLILKQLDGRYLNEVLVLKDFEHKTALQHACKENHFHIAQDIIKKCQEKDVDPKSFLLVRDKDLRTVFHEAITYGNRNFFNFLVKVAENMNCNFLDIFHMRDCEGITPLFEAMLQNDQELINTMMKKAESTDILRQLLEPQDGRTVFHWACVNEKVKIQCLKIVVHFAKTVGLGSSEDTEQTSSSGLPSLVKQRLAENLEAASTEPDQSACQTSSGGLSSFMKQRLTANLEPVTTEPEQSAHQTSSGGLPSSLQQRFTAKIEGVATEPDQPATSHKGRSGGFLSSLLKTKLTKSPISQPARSKSDYFTELLKKNDHKIFNLENINIRVIQCLISEGGESYIQHVSEQPYILHGAVKRDFIDVIRYLLGTAQKYNGDYLDKLLFGTKSKPDTIFHWIAKYCDVSSSCMGLLVFYAEKSKRLKSDKTLKMNLLMLALKTSNRKLVRVFLSKQKETQISEASEKGQHWLLSRDQQQKTILHWACSMKDLDVSLLKEVLKQAQYDGIFTDLVLRPDAEGKSFLCYIDKANKDVMQFLINELCKYDEQKGSQKKPQNDSQKKPPDCIIELLAPTSVMTKKPKAESKTKPEESKTDEASPVHKLTTAQKQMLQNFLEHAPLTQIADKSPLECTSPQNRHMFKQIFDHLYNKSEKGSEDDFGLLHDLELHMMRKEVLDDQLYKFKCVELIQHDYIQQYLEICWKSKEIAIVWLNLVLCLLLVISFTLYLFDHEYHTVSSKDTLVSNSTDVVFQSGQMANVCKYIFLAMAILNLLYEILDLIFLRKRYFLQLENYIDVIVSILCIVVFAAQAGTSYNHWQHVLTLCTAFLSWIRLAWTFTKIALPGNNIPARIVQGTSLRILMLFSVAFEVLKYLPVFMLCIFGFAILFDSLFQEQEPFDYFGHAYMKVMAMSIGELDFDNLFFGSTESPFQLLGFVVFFLFVCIMTITVMNLFIALATGEVSQLQQDNVCIAFKNQIDAIREAQYFRKKLVKLFGQRTCTKTHKKEKMAAVMLAKYHLKKTDTWND